MIRSLMPCTLMLFTMLVALPAAQGSGQGPGENGSGGPPRKRQAPSARQATDIWHGATIGRIGDVRAFLDRKPRLATAVDGDQRTALHLAARYGHLQIVELLLARGATPDAVAYNQFTPLHMAVMFNRPKVLELLFQHEIDLNAKTAFGLAPIDLAAQRFRWPLVDRLIKQGAKYSAYAAASRGDKEQIAKLLKPPTARVGRNALLQAIHRGHAEIAARMLPRVIDAPLMPNEMRQPLLFEATQHAPVVKALLAAGEDASARTAMQGMGGPPPGSTLLHVAATRGHHETVALLLTLKEFRKPDVRNTNQLTPAHEAAHHGQLKTLQLLHRHGADLRAKDRQGRTTVHHAAVAGKPEILHWLVKLGIVLHDLDNSGRTALQLGTKGIHPTDKSTANRLEAAWILVRHGVTVDLLSAAVIGDTLRAKVLLEANPQLAESKGLLVRALSLGNKDIVALLLDAGADVNTLDSRRSNYLHWAALWRQAAGAELLIARGCDVHAANKWGYTPLHEAARANATAIAKALLAAGARRDTKDGDGNTPLGLLTNHSPDELRKLLK